MDAGADLSLLSEEFYSSLPNPPKLKQGLKLRLIQIIGAVKVIGYLTIPVFLKDSTNTTIKFLAETYVV